MLRLSNGPAPKVFDIFPNVLIVHFSYLIELLICDLRKFRQFFIFKVIQSLVNLRSRGNMQSTLVWWSSCADPDVFLCFFFSLTGVSCQLSAGGQIGKKWWRAAREEHSFEMDGETFAGGRRRHFKQSMDLSERSMFIVSFIVMMPQRKNDTSNHMLAALLYVKYLSCYSSFNCKSIKCCTPLFRTKTVITILNDFGIFVGICSLHKSVFWIIIHNGAYLIIILLSYICSADYVRRVTNY